MRKEGTESICTCCGKSFYRPPSNRGPFCSKPCWYKSKPKADFYERAWRYIDKSGGDDACWPWTGSILKTGYGAISVGWKQATKRAHRVAYESVKGPIPEGLHILHTCDNRPCCNPAHLFLGNAKINSDDKLAKGRANTHRKFSFDDVTAMRQLHASGHTGRYIAKIFNASEGAVSVIVRGKARLHN